MKRVVLTLVTLLFTLSSYAPLESEIISNRVMIIEFEENQLITQNLYKLTDRAVKTRTEVYKLVQPVIEIYMKRGNYKQLFPLLQDSISHALACIFVSESSNTLGQSAKSSLWLNHFNPFGLTSTNGVTKQSWEMIEGKKVIMNRTFKTFNNFQEALDSLLINYLNKTRFSKARESTGVKHFFDNLYICGYMTNKYWPDFAYSQIYLKANGKKM